MLWSDAPAAVPNPYGPTVEETAGRHQADEVDPDDATAMAGWTAPDPAGTGETAASAGVDAGVTWPDPTEAPEADPADARQAGVAADEAFLAEAAAELDAIQAALVRLDDGSFDRCQVCGGRIGQERLMADPLATRCAAHA